MHEYAKRVVKMKFVSHYCLFCLLLKSPSLANFKSRMSKLRDTFS